MSTIDMKDLINQIRATNRQINPIVIDPEDYQREPNAAPDSIDRKPPYKLKDLYPDIANYRQLPTERYMSREFMEKEWTHMWKKTWLVAGLAYDVREVGDWFKYDIGRESIIVVRSDKDTVKAFYNVCKHRGYRLIEEDFGKGAKNFTCNYHSWMYKIDGENARVTDRYSFTQEALCGNLNLSEIHVRVHSGFVFINMDKNPIPFEEYFGDDPLRMLAPYDIENMQIVKEVSCAVPANWKTLMDAFVELYHVHQTHPQGLLGSDDHFVQYNFYKNGHNLMIVPRGTSLRRPDHEEINDVNGILLSDVGIDPKTFKGKVSDIREIIRAERRKPDNVFGLDYSRFSDSQTIDNWNVSLFPNTMVSLYPEGVMVQRYLPHPTDPDQSFFHVQYIVARIKPGAKLPYGVQTVFGVDPNNADEMLSDKAHREILRTDVRNGLDTTELNFILNQDVEQIGRVHEGMKSAGLDGFIRLSEQERRIQQFNAELDLYLEERK